MADSLDLSDLGSAVHALDRALEIASADEWLRMMPEARDVVAIPGVIQNFELAYELSIKLIRRRLQLDRPEDIVSLPFRDLVRLAVDSGLIADPKPWFGYRDLRNRTSHTYDKTKAHDVVERVPPFLADARWLLSKLEARNG